MSQVFDSGWSIIMNSGKKENNKELKNISLVVDNEQDLYTPLNPEAEFNWTVKQYVKSKAADIDDHQNIQLTVIAKVPLDEEIFRSAVSSLINEEKTILAAGWKEAYRMFIGLLCFGTALLLLTLFFEKMVDVLQYSLMPIMSSLALGRAVRILIIEMPIIRAKRRIIDELEKNNVIIFKYDHANEIISDEKENGA